MSDFTSEKWGSPVDRSQTSPIENLPLEEIPIDLRPGAKIWLFDLDGTTLTPPTRAGWASVEYAARMVYYTLFPKIPSKEQTQESRSTLFEIAFSRALQESSGQTDSLLIDALLRALKIEVKSDVRDIIHKLFAIHRRGYATGYHERELPQTDKICGQVQADTLNLIHYLISERSMGKPISIGICTGNAVTPQYVYPSGFALEKLPADLQELFINNGPEGDCFY